MPPTVFPCPGCGRETNRHGEPFDSPRKTKKHIGAMGSDHADPDEIQAVERDADELPDEDQRGTGQATNMVETELFGEQSLQQTVVSNHEYIRGVNDHAVSIEEDLGDTRQLAESAAENAEDLRERVERLERVTGNLLQLVGRLLATHNEELKHDKDGQYLINKANE